MVVRHDYLTNTITYVLNNFLKLDFELLKEEQY